MIAKFAVFFKRIDTQHNYGGLLLECAQIKEQGKSRLAYQRAKIKDNDRKKVKKHEGRNIIIQDICL